MKRPVEGYNLRSLPMKTLFAPLILALLAISLSAPAADWPQWRGPHRDGVIKDPNHQLDKLPAEPKILWTLDAGPGHSSPVVAGNRLVFLDGVNDQEVAHCVDAATGKELWSVPVGPMVEFSNYGSGPRCTPLIDGDRVYAQSSGGEFNCLSLADGKTLWHVSFGKDFGATFIGNKSGDPSAKDTASRRHGNNGSAAIEDGRIFVPVGSINGATLVGYDKKTGRELWRAGSDNTAYSSVMAGTLAGVKQAVHFTADALMGVDAASGKILWRTPIKSGAKRHACTPVISGDDVVVASATIGTLKFHISKAGGEFKCEQAWANPQCKTNIATPTLVGDALFTVGPGTSRTDLTCLDFKTGSQLWAQRGLADYASITAVNDKLLVLNSTGELFLVRANPAKYEELGRAQICAKTWASPAYVDGRLFIKDERHLTALAIAP